MYHYIIDQSRIPSRNFDRLLGEVYGFLTEYQIGGEVHRVTRLRNVEELTETASRFGARTLVAVGDDQLFLQVLESTIDNENLVLGFIPLVKSQIAKILGLGDITSACKAIAQRRVENFDLGLVNRHHFFTSINFGLFNTYTEEGQVRNLGTWNILTRGNFSQPIPVNIKVDNKYNLFVNIVAGAIYNARDPNLCGFDSRAVSSAQDNQLDLMLVEKLSTREMLRYKEEINSGCFEKIPNTTVLHGKSFEIDGPKTMTISVGLGNINRLPLNVSLARQKLRVIVGKAHRP